MSDDPPVLQLHHPADNRFSLRFLSDDKQARSEKAPEWSEQSDIEMAIAEESVDSDTICLLYTRTLFDTAYPEFETEEDVIEWFDTGGQKAINRFSSPSSISSTGSLQKEEQGSSFATYKKMDLEKIPDVLNSVGWRQLNQD